MTEQQILTKLTAVCSRAEHCKEDMRRKMERWEVEDDMQEKVIAYLVKEHRNPIPAKIAQISL